MKFITIIALTVVCVFADAKFKVTVVSDDQPKVEVASKPDSSPTSTSLPAQSATMSSATQTENNNLVAQVDVKGESKLPVKAKMPAMKKGIDFNKPIGNVVIERLRVWSSDDNTRAVFDMSASTDYKLAKLDNPPRIEIQFENAVVDPTLMARKNRDIKDVVVSDENKVVMSLINEVDIKSFILGPHQENGYRVVVDLKKRSPAAPLASVPKKRAKSVTKTEVKPKPKLTPRLVQPSYTEANHGIHNEPKAIRAVNIVEKSTADKNGNVGADRMVSMLAQRDDVSSSPTLTIKEDSLSAVYGVISGNTVDDVLTKWAGKSNHMIRYELGIWKRIKQLTISIDTDYNSDFKGAVHEFLGALNMTPQLRENNVSLMGCFYKNNVVKIAVGSCGVGK